ncbi:MAG: PUA domain-containing protein, partial [Candidatus Nanoarchaeia archaeon]
PPRISAVARKLREREIYWLKIKKIRDKKVKFEVGCEAGTYIRKLCHDIGSYLGVGAHMTALERIQAGPFKIENSITLKEIKKNYLNYLRTKNVKYIRKIILEPENAVHHLPSVYVDDAVIERLKHGSPVFVPGILAFTSDIKEQDVVAIFDKNKNLLGLGISTLSAEKLKLSDKGLAIKTDVVLI